MKSVIPAQAGIQQKTNTVALERHWIPASAITAVLPACLPVWQYLKTMKV